MSKAEIGRLTLLNGALDGKYTVSFIAKKLGISMRQVKRLKAAVKGQGEESVIHGNSGRHPANYKDDGLRQKIVALKRSALYEPTNFTYFCELLLEREGIKIGYTTLCAILKAEGIVSKKSHRTEGKKFRRRKRRSGFGELLQGDATPFDWFGKGERQALHGFIDDATGRLVGLYMCENECLQGYLETLRQCITKQGVPMGIYTDKAGIFSVNGKKPEHWTLDEQLAGKTLDKTQFGMICDELGINLILAHSPQAKGRVERLWGTLQDRLVTYLKIETITNMAQFNRSAKKIMNWFNTRFAVKDTAIENSFVPLGDTINLDNLLTVKFQRTTDTCGCFSFRNLKFEIQSPKAIFKKKIIFLFSEKIGYSALYNNKYYPVKPLDFLNDSQDLTAVTQSLLYAFYLADGKATPLPSIGRG
jgi:transposase